MLVSVIIVNFNGRHFLEACLASLQQQTLALSDYEVIVVDNASSDGSVAFVRERYPDVRIVEAETNLGFAGGNLVGLQHAHGRYIALLNNDATAEPDWLRNLVAAVESGAEIGGVASKVVFAHDPTTINSAGLVLYRDGRGGDRGFRCADDERFSQAAEVFGACGAAALYRREMIDDVGFFDPQFFMYYEDLDLAWRARRRGWRFIYAPDAVVRHVHCGSSGEWSPAFTYFVERNRALANIRNGSLWLALWTCVGLILRMVRCWARVLLSRSRQWTVNHGWAYVRALAALLAALPAAVAARSRLAATQSAPPSAYRHLVERSPARAA